MKRPVALPIARMVLIALLLSLLALQGSHAAESSQGKSSASSGMTLAQALVLGVVEGVTEFLPVSSTGHLLIAEKLMNLDRGDTEGGEASAKEAADAYAICIQGGAILAVLGLYMRRVRQMCNGLFGRDPAGFRMVVNLAAAFVPAMIIGLLFNKAIKAYLFGPWPVVAAWFVGGAAILMVSRWRASKAPQWRSGLALDEMRMRMALVIGMAQCIAMWPGVSRSLVTIVGGVLVGLSVPAAVEFSFLLGVITLGAATAYDALKHGSVMLQTFDWLSITVGIAAAFASAVVSIQWMVSYLNRHGLEIFGYYRIAAAAVALVLILAGVL